MRQNESRHTETDVLVIGAGGAGLRAAIEARRAGARVLLVSKTPLGEGNCSAYAMGFFAAAVGGKSVDEHYSDTLEAGRGLNDERLVRVLVEEAPQRIAELSEFGVKWDETRGGANFSRYGPPGRMGIGLTHPLRAYAARIGVESQESIQVVDLIKSGSEVAGAVGFNFRSGQWHTYRAGAVVLATGGVGRIYRRTDNPVRTTGDGCALALRAGATLQDMEFIQFYPFGLAHPGLPVFMLLMHIADYAPLVNREGREFLRDYYQRWGVKSTAEANVRARDLAAQAIAREILEGRGVDGAVLLRVSEVPEAQWTRPYLGFLRSRLLRSRPLAEPVRIAPIMHYTVGGIRIDPSTATDVPGLFAAGECASGWAGANRLGGNSLSAIIVFGAHAGTSAARYAAQSDRRALPSDVLDEARRAVERWAGANGPSPQALTAVLQRLSEQHLWVLRSGEGLEEFLAELCGLEDEARNARAVSPAEIRDAFELKNLLVCARAVAQSALLRRESRGGHYRLDYPGEGGREWLRHTAITGKDGVATLV
ncbi:MAG: FAD-dependent oxidoreductase [Chloroflexota bacterium]